MASQIKGSRTVFATPTSFVVDGPAPSAKTCPLALHPAWCETNIQQNWWHMFELKQLRHTYDGQKVLHLDRWSVAQGEHWLILGPSGSGKTTLLHILAGILTPSEGSVAIAGQDLDKLPSSERDRFRGRHIGIVFQRLHLIASLTVLDNLLLAQYLASATQDLQGARALLTSLGLADKANSRPHALSFGQSQRAAVARAVVNKPLLILADEPTSNLDDANAVAALDVLLAQAQSCNATLVIASHDRRITERLENRFALGARS
jgi:putative ABC transport system ATP-binding protein